MKHPFSLIYPMQDKRTDVVPFACFGDIIHQLGADWFLYEKNVTYQEFITKDIDTIRYREEAFFDIINLPELLETLKACCDTLTAIDTLRKAQNNAQSNESMLYAIKEVEMFVDFAVNMANGLENIAEKLTSRAFKALQQSISETVRSESFCSLQKSVQELAVSVRDIKSLTIGVNLDANLSPYESGIVGINTEYFHSGDLVSRFMRMEIKKEDMITLAPLSVTAKLLSSAETEGMNMAIAGGLKKIVGSGFRGWQSMLHKYFMVETDPYIRLLPELLFLIGGANIIQNLKNQRLPICYPEVRPMSEKCFCAKGLYNPAMAEKLRGIHPTAKIVLNDFAFDKQGSLYILTGPNHGGKSVILCAVGIAQLMFQLGLPIAAESAQMSPVDGIFTHFTTQAGSTVGKGRLGEECLRLQTLLERVTEHSMVLFDETLSSTDSYEASAIAFEILTGLALFGCRGIFATHLHELAQRTEEINTTEGLRSRIDNLVAGMEFGERTYVITRKRPDGKSYARDIANKYGLSLENILSRNRMGEDSARKN